MALVFRSQTLPITGDIEIGPWAYESAITTFNNLIGESEQRGKRRGRDITFDGWWYNSYTTSAQLEAAIENFNKDIPINGDLIQSGSMSRTLRRCTFYGVDVKHIYPPSTIGWFAVVQLRWRQLAPTPPAKP